MELGRQEREGLPHQIQSYIRQLECDLQESRNDHEQLQSRHQALKIRHEHLKDEYRLLLYKRFGRSSEQEQSESQQQLFEEAESTADEQAFENDRISVAEHTRKKRGRKPIDDSVPRVDIVHDIPEEEKHCGCGHELVRIGEEVSERLQVIPEQIYAERHIRPKYACHYCEGSGDEENPAVRITAAAPSLIPGSIVTAGLLAFIATNKFVDHLPLYRQSQRFQRLGITLSRQDMSNWIVWVGTRASPLIQRFVGQIREGPMIGMDETRLQVLREPGRENTKHSYMWLSRGGVPEAPVCVYWYHQRRNDEYPRTLLHDYRGYVQVDGYEVYDKVAAVESGIILVGCWAHARRKFHEASKAGKKTGAAHEGLNRIRKLYQIEKTLRAKQLDDEQFVADRRAKVEPELESFRRWLEKKQQTVVPSSLLGKSVAYTLGQWDKLIRYLDHAILTPDNNKVEGSIRPFVVGRKNFLFSGSPRGAHASCAIYSIIETGKLNGFNPYAYLHYVFTRMPHIRTPEDWDALLPSNLDAKTVNSAFLADVR